MLTLDAFGTLITPREPIAKQYAEAARRHGLAGFSEEDIAKDFRVAFKNESTQNPNYGKATGLGARRWWANVRLARSFGMNSGLMKRPFTWSNILPSIPRLVCTKCIY